MKTIFKILLVISFFTIFAQNAKAEDTLNPCWTMVFPHDPDNGYFNPDSVLYDSCFCKNIYIDGCDSIYSKQWYDLTFLNKDPFNFPQFPEDTIIETTWQDLDSSYVDMRNMFQTLEIMFGPFILRKQFPDDTDSSSLGSRGYIMKFQNYCNIASVINYLTSFNFFYFVYYQMQAVRFTDVVNENLKYNNYFKIYPIPCNEFINITLFFENLSTYKIYITDIFGRNFFNKIYQINQIGEQKLYINTDMLSEGTYFCIIQTDKQKLIKKFLVIR